MLAGALQRRAVGKMLLARAPQWQRYCWQGRRGGAAGRGAVAEILLPGRTIGKKMLAGGAVAELLPAAAERHYDTKKKRVTPKPSWTCGSPSCLLTNC